MAKKSISKQRFGSKSAFVRGLPGDMPAKEVVAEAANRGMKLSIGQVYNIRSVAKKRVGGPRRGPSPRPRALVAASPGGSGASSSAGGSGAESQLRKIIAELGLSRARDVLAQVEAAFRG